MRILYVRYLYIWISEKLVKNMYYRIMMYLEGTEVVLYLIFVFLLK